MPRYFFVLAGAGGDPDVDGTEPSGPEEALAEAVTYMAGMVKDIDGQIVSQFRRASESRPRR